MFWLLTRWSLTKLISRMYFCTVPGMYRQSLMKSHYDLCICDYDVGLWFNHLRWFCTSKNKKCSENLTSFFFNCRVRRPVLLARHDLYGRVQCYFSCPDCDNVLDQQWNQLWPGRRLLHWQCSLLQSSIPYSWPPTPQLYSRAMPCPHPQPCWRRLSALDRLHECKYSRLVHEVGIQQEESKETQVSIWNFTFYSSFAWFKIHMYI